MDTDLCNICRVSLFVMHKGKVDCLLGSTVSYVGMIMRWCLYRRTKTAGFMYFTKEGSLLCFQEDAAVISAEILFH